MASSQDNNRSVAERARQLRLQGQLNQALHLVSQHLGSQPQDRAAMAEGVRVLVCLGQAEAAVGLYQALTADPAADHQLEPPALVRLALLLGRRELLEEMAVPEGPAWLVSLLGQGEDPAEGLQIRALETRIQTGHSHFHLRGSCPYCGHYLEQQVKDNLLVWRLFVCPACFGKVRLDHQLAAAALKDVAAAGPEGDLTAVDDRLITRVRPRVTGEEPSPFIVRAVAQEYHFLLNEMALLCLEGAAGNGGKGPGA